MGTQSETVLKSFQTEFLDKKQNIIIPLLQRDYVQGGRLDVIDPFLNKLIDAISKEQTQINLEYIYGYNTENGFVPIDGQQRLITLWLLHLYIYANNNEPLPIELKFESREFADNFCTQLRENLCDILNPEQNSQEGSGDGSSNRKDTKDITLEETIKDCKWFVAGWLLDTTVRNMLKTLQLIDDKKNLIPDDPHTENITFDFLDMKDKGLDDDVYVKMNGRGRPLTYFENLKSWMDEYIENIYGKKDEFTKDWKTRIDNEWTDLFWQNRNKKDKHPEEIDDEQIRFFYSMLLLYWKKNENSFLTNLEKPEKATTRSNYISFLNDREKEGGKLSEKSTIKDIQEKTFSLLLNGKKMLPLYWIEETEMLNKEVFEFINNSLESLKENENYVNELPEGIVDILDFEKEQTILYQIAFNEATYAKTLPLLYSLIKTPERYKNELLYQWIRLWRNLVLNSDITAENIKNACETIETVSNKVDADNLYQVVAELQWKKGSAFSEEQFEEEVAKAKMIVENPLWEDEFVRAESYPYLLGKIWILFQNNNVTTLETFKARYNLLCSLIDNKEDKYHLVKVLLSRYQHDKPHTKLELKRSPEKWKKLITKDLSQCFINTEKDEIADSKLKYVEYLTKTMLLNKRAEQNELNLKSYGDKVVLFGKPSATWHSYNNIILDKMHCDNLLLQKYPSDWSLKIDNKNIYIGEHIDFRYSNVNKFRWHTNGYIYLMIEQDKYWPRPNPKQIKDLTEEDKYYCFKVADYDDTAFAKRLALLIVQQQADENETIEQK